LGALRQHGDLVLELETFWNAGQDLVWETELFLETLQTFGDLVGHKSFFGALLGWDLV
jgi:hypothetical protein